MKKSQQHNTHKHKSQPRPRKAVMLDLNVDSKIHAAYGTVVASRVRDRSDVLILRPFPLWLFQRGATEGPSLLLSKLRGEHIDWQAMHGRPLAQGPLPKLQGAEELGRLRLRAVGDGPSQPRRPVPGVPARFHRHQGAAEAEHQRDSNPGKERCLQPLPLHQNRRGFPTGPNWHRRTPTPSANAVRAGSARPS